MQIIVYLLFNIVVFYVCKAASVCVCVCVCVSLVLFTVFNAA